MSLALITTRRTETNDEVIKPKRVGVSRERNASCSRVNTSRRHSCGQLATVAAKRVEGDRPKW
jgi:hypothetical protein